MDIARRLKRYRERADRMAFRLGYHHGRAGRPWPEGKTTKPEQDPYYRGWNLGHRVSRRLVVRGIGGYRANYYR